MKNKKEILKEKAIKANVARTEIAGTVNTKWTPDAIKLYEEWVVKIKKMSPHLKEKQVELLAEVAAEAKLGKTRKVY